MAEIEDNNYDNEKQEDEEECEDQESSSSELTELESETKQEDENPWRKGKLTTEQYGLKKFDKLFPSELKKDILKSESRFATTLNKLLEQVTEVENVWESTDARLGENIRKGLFAINKISNSALISLRRPNVALFLGKVFEYLKATPRNPVVCLRVLHLLVKTRLDCMDLTHVETTVNRPEYVEFLIDEVLESVSPKDTDLRIGQEALKKCYRLLLAVVGKINVVFASNFAVFKDLIQSRRLDLYTKKGLSFRLSFVPYKRLDQADTEFMAFEIRTAQHLDTKLPVDQSSAIYSRLMKNRLFKPNKDDVQRIIRDANELPSSMMKTPMKSQKGLVNRMAGLLANLIFKPGLSEDDLSLVINTTVGFFDTIVDEFHPKSPMSVKKAYFQILIQYFLTHYVREAKKAKKKNADVYQKIKEAIHPVLKKIMNFSIFDRFMGTFEKGLMALCYLDKDYFMDYLLQKVRFSFDFEEFRKVDVIRLLGSVAEIYTGDEKYSGHLMWILPKLLQELSNSAEAKNVEETSAVISSILENFVGLESLKSKSHLESMRNDIDEAALRYLNFYLQRAETYTMRKEALRVVASISEFLSKKVKEKITSLIKSGFSKVSPDNVSNFLTVVYRLFPKDTDAELVKWIKDKVLVETETYDTETLSMGSALASIGCGPSIKHKLSSQNDKTLKEQTKVLKAIIPLSFMMSEDLLTLSALSLSLIADHDNDDISKEGVVALSAVFNDCMPKITNVVSMVRLRETTMKDGCNSFAWEFPEKTYRDRIVTLVKAFILSSFNVANSLIESTQGREVQADVITQIYKDTLAEKKTEIEEEEKTNKANLKKLTVIIRFLAVSLKSQWLRAAYINSIHYQSKFSELKVNILSYFAKTGTLKNPKLRDCYVSLLLTNLRVANLALEGEEVYRLYLKAMQGYYAYFDQVDTTFRCSMLELIFNNYFTLLGYFYPSEVLSIDSLSKDVLDVEPHELWFFGGNLEKTFIIDALEENLKSAIVFAVDNFHTNLQKETNQHFDRWVILDESYIRDYLLAPISKIMNIEQSSSEKYSATAIQVRDAIYLFMSKIYIQEESTVECILDLSKAIALKSDFAKIQGIFFQFTNYLMLSASLSHDSKWRAEFQGILHKLRTTDDSAMTLADLVAHSIKLLLTYEAWSVDDRASFGLTCLLGAASKNINKRIVFMSMLFFLNRLLKKSDWKEEKVVILATPFADNSGWVKPETTKEAFKEIKKNIGLSDKGSDSITADQKLHLQNLDSDCYCGQASQYLSLPFEALKYSRISDTVKSFNILASQEGIKQGIEATFLEFLKIAIMEYSDTVEESNLAVKYSYAEYMVSIERKGSINRESLILVTFKQASVLLGVESILKIIRQLEADIADKNSDFKKVLLILFCAMLSSSNYYSDAEYSLVLDYGKELMIPLMNSYNAKHLQTLMIYLFVTLKNVSFRRTQAFYSLVIEEMDKCSPENKSYFLNILVFQISTNNLMLSDSVEVSFNSLAPAIEVNDLNNVRALAKFYATILSVRYSAYFTPTFQPSAGQSFSSEDLTLIAMTDKDLTIRHFIDFLAKTKASKILVRMECLKSLALLFKIKAIDAQNYSFMEELVSIIFTLDPNEDLGVSQLVTAMHKLMEQLRGEMAFSNDVKEQLLAFLSRTYDTLHSVDCLKSLIKMVRRGVGSEITPALEEILLKVAKDPRVPLRDAIESLFRHDVFSSLSNKVMYTYAKSVFSKIDQAVSEK